MARFWRIRGYSSMELIYEKEVTIGSFSENQMEEVLRALAAKAGLENDEILGAYARKNASIRNEHLEVRRGGGNPDKPDQPFYIECGHNPHFVALVITK